MRECPYCGKPPKKVFGNTLYPHRRDLAEKKFWQCVPCEAYVGCHPHEGWRPLGRLANAELRAAKIRAHQAFDPLWNTGEMARSAAYKWLSETLGVEPAMCHIGMFDVAMCNLVVEKCNELKEKQA